MMALTDIEIIAIFNEEVGSSSMTALTDDTEKIGWYNEGVNRLSASVGRYKPNYVDITWSLADRTKDLPDDFIEIDKIVTDSGYVPQAWRAFGQGSNASLKLDDSDGATQAGAARVYYWSEWPLVTIGGVY
jgi:hypothetical protein